MASCSLNDQAPKQKYLSSTELLSLLNLRDKLYNELRQAAALVVVAKSDDFLDFHEPFVQDYLSIL